MKDLNKDKLIEGLQKLPEYKVPDFVWDKINTELERDPVLAKAIKEMPVHKAPDHVWTSIEKSISKKPLIVQIGGLKRIAAAIAILIVLSLGINTMLDSSSTDPFDALAVSVSEEVINDAILVDQDNEDQMAIEELLLLCSNMEFICTRPRISKIKNDLLELSEAKKMLKQALGEFGTEVYLIQQLKDIEIEQSHLIKELTKQLT